jgi:predicted nucleic acid-binding protein
LDLRRQVRPHWKNGRVSEVLVRATAQKCAASACVVSAFARLPFDLASARRWAQLSAALGHHGADLQSAATALEHGLTVVTRNRSDLEPTGVATLNPFSLPPRRTP